MFGHDTTDATVVDELDRPAVFGAALSESSRVNVMIGHFSAERSCIVNAH